MSNKNDLCLCEAKTLEECDRDCLFVISFDGENEPTISDEEMQSLELDADWLEAEYLRLHGNANH